MYVFEYICVCEYRIVVVIGKLEGGSEYGSNMEQGAYNKLQFLWKYVYFN